MDSIFAIALAVIAGVTVGLLFLVLRLMKRMNSINHSLDFLDSKLDSNAETILEVLDKHENDFKYRFDNMDKYAEELREDTKSKIDDISAEIENSAQDIVENIKDVFKKEGE